MFKDLSRLIACALLVCLSVEPLPFLGLVESGSPSAACCKDKKECCCRRSHGDSNGPTLAADPACRMQCHVPVRSVKPVAVTAPQRQAMANAAPITERPMFEPARAARAQLEVSLYQRPPPAEI
jgi:hypothetical protein